MNKKHASVNMAATVTVSVRLLQLMLENVIDLEYHSSGEEKAFVVRIIPINFSPVIRFYTASRLRTL